MQEEKSNCGNIFDEETTGGGKGKNVHMHACCFAIPNLFLKGAFRKKKNWC